MTPNEEAKALLNDEALSTIKNTAMLVAIEHHLFNVDVALKMVEQNKLFGFGFEADPELFKTFKGNVWAAPAYAWATDQTMQNAVVKWVQNMADAARGEFPYRVN
jgi:lactate dehydrogenase-like 2-hydroxyacid dehydrogenase